MLDKKQICALVEPFTKCTEVVGLCLMGSYSAGDANELSDLDIGVFFEHEPVALPSIDWPFAHDLWLVGCADREQWGKYGGWRASAFLTACMLFDRDGRANQYIEDIVSAKGYSMAARVEYWDGYLNGFYRSLKYCRKGREYGHRACAAESVLRFSEALFFENGLISPLPGRERASLWRVKDKLIKDDDAQMELLTHILRDGDTKAQARLFSFVEPYLYERGLGKVIDDWEGLLHLEIERAGIYE